MTSHRLLAVLALLAFGAGCAAVPSALYDDTYCQDGGCQNTPPDGGAMTDALLGAYDATGDAPTLTPARASLCSMTPCYPDETLSCVVAADSGVTADDAGLESCHVAAGGTSVCSSTGTRRESESCNTSADCAPGYECTSDGTCHHYCCNDTACADLTQNSTTGMQYFCDVDHEKTNVSITVPVCFAVQHCQPLNGATCGTGHSCTLVEVNNGMQLQLVATCDITGSGTLGQSCETEQCADGFACIGSIGSRTCQQLCNSYNPCPGMLTCNMKSSGSYNVGICQ